MQGHQTLLCVMLLPLLMAVVVLAKWHQPLDMSPK
jgi:hypothetical protein